MRSLSQLRNEPGEFLPDRRPHVLGVNDGLEDSGHYRRAHPVARDVAYQQEVAVGQERDDVVVVSAAIQGRNGPVARPELDPIRARERGPQYRLLHLSRPFQLIHHNPQILRVLALELAVVVGLLKLGDEIIAVPGLEHIAENSRSHGLDELLGFGKPGEEDRDDVGVELADLQQKIRALHLRHFKVGYDDYRILAPLRKDLEPLPRRDGGENLEAASVRPFAEFARKRIQYVLLVIDEEYASLAGSHCRLRIIVQ